MNFKNARRRFVRIFLIFIAVSLLSAGIVLGVYYRWFSAMIDARISGNMTWMESRIFTSPRRIAVGQLISPERLASYLQTAGYSTSAGGGIAGSISIGPSFIEIRPSANSYFAGKNALHVGFSGKRISLIRSIDTGQRLISGLIEPEFITGLFGRAREKRRPVAYQDLPRDLRNAILCAEDKRFFDHPGFDPVRVLGAALADLRSGQKSQGASTITMQVARSFFFTTRREWRRKLKETYMALILEHRFSKERIFELYANEVYLGNRGSFAIHGFGEAAQAYFDKDVRELNLGQICFLAGIIRAPNRYSSAERRPERAAEARDRVLALMADQKFITAAQVKEAKEEPLQIVSSAHGAGKAGYFIDLVKDELLDQFSEPELNSQNYRIYTTLDPDLQQAAAAAVEFGLRSIDSQLERAYALWRKRGESVPSPQAALVALDPHSGAIKALIGGRDYAKSQLNRALTQRQPGSAFKPFVYAAAFENALEGIDPVLTPTSRVADEPTTFMFDGREYTPSNYGEKYYGNVALREALVHSMNIATIKVAQSIGYRRMASFARRLGLGPGIKATPAVALGAYEMSPMEVAAGYTVFANYGTRCEPTTLQQVVGRSGNLLQSSLLRKRRVLDPRVSYLVTNIMEDVVNRGTGAGVRTRGFRAPAAAKTGTSHDGWFAGYTTNLLCVVWVGFDDNRELGLSGAVSAGPIWAEFMKQAMTLPDYYNAQQFERPEGVVSVAIDAETLALGTSDCPYLRQEVFIAGTEPTEACTVHQSSRLDDFIPLSRILSLFGGDD